MDQFQANPSIHKKWERHFRNTKTIISVFLIILGICFALPLAFLWPQILSSYLFNSKLSYHLIMDIEDYFTCSKDYQNFVIMEPAEDDTLMSIYLFNITNAADVFQRGYKPVVAETGPYGFQKYTYKYSVEFDEVDSLYLSFKEYNILKEVNDDGVCKRMYYRIGNADNSLSTDPCSNNNCNCQSYDEVLTIVNPLFLKLLVQEKPFSIMSYYSTEIFKTIKNLIENDFVVATKAHLVHEAMQEIYAFRQQMQIYSLLNTSYSYLLNHGYNETSIVSLMDNYDSSQYSKFNPSDCGLSIYDINECNFFELSTMIQDTKKNRNLQQSNATIQYPSVKPLFERNNPLSLFNLDYGLPRWLALCFYQGYIDLGFDNGYTMVSADEYRELYQNFTKELSVYTFGVNSNHSGNTTATSRVIVNSVIKYLSNTYINSYKSQTLSLLFDEFNKHYDEVACEPLGTKCIWQWGYIRHYYSTQPYFNLSTIMIDSLINYASKSERNPNNIYDSGNVLRYYNSYIYCSKFGYSINGYNSSDSLCSSTNYSFTLSDAIASVPSGLWGTNYYQSNSLDMTVVTSQFLKQSNLTKLNYFNFACNVSTLIYRIYPSSTQFHDIYVMKYLNKFKSSALTHTFSLNRSKPLNMIPYIQIIIILYFIATAWLEVGWAQWGGGFITEALTKVKAVNQIKRNGMWYFGSEAYYEFLIEYSSWAILAGFPSAFITNVYHVEKLLNILADDTIEYGIKFRQLITFISTTYIGDGENYINGVGAVGDKTFVLEANTGNFSCPSEIFSESCDVISTFITSSPGQCHESMKVSLYTTIIVMIIFTSFS